MRAGTLNVESKGNEISKTNNNQMRRTKTLTNFNNLQLNGLNLYEEGNMIQYLLSNRNLDVIKEEDMESRHDQFSTYASTTTATDAGPLTQRSGN